MSAGPSGSIVDHYLVARVQSCATGANAHEAHSLLGSYLGIASIAEEDPGLRPRVEAIEQRLRAFCQTGRARESRWAD